MKHLVGITGSADSGKDTVGNMLRQRRGYHTMALAEPLRAALTTILGLDASHYDRPLKELALPLIDKSPRQLMQSLATEWGRNMVHPDLWVMLAARKIADIREQYPNANIIITDVRFDNEAKMIRTLGGEIWKLHRTGAHTPHSHVSEAGIDRQYIDRYIDNNGTLDDLQNKVEGFVLDWLMPEPPRNNKPLCVVMQEMKRRGLPAAIEG